jgi:hypothetical protein
MVQDVFVDNVPQPVQSSLTMVVVYNKYFSIRPNYTSELK